MAPQDGVIGQRQVKPGQFVGVGGQVTSLTPLPNVWVIANFKETQLTHMAVGEKAEVRGGPTRGIHCRAMCWRLPPEPRSQFALLPPDNATGNFTKVVQRVAVKIAIDDADGVADAFGQACRWSPTVDAKAGGVMSAAGGPDIPFAAPPVGGRTAGGDLRRDFVPWLGWLRADRAPLSRPLNTPSIHIGLGDIRGAVHAGFDEGAWISTAQTVAQMLVRWWRSGWAASTARARC